MNFNIMDFISVSIQNIFFFAPGILSMFALSILVLDLNRYYDRENTKKATFFKYIIDILYLIYTFFRMIPIDSLNFSFSYTNWQEVLGSIMSILPYVCTILFIKVIQKNKYVHFFINYYTMHIYFIVACLIYNYMLPNTVDLWWALIYTCGSPIISNFVELKRR
jgi:hypothetical protein